MKFKLVVALAALASALPASPSARTLAIPARQEIMKMNGASMKARRRHGQGRRRRSMRPKRPTP